MKRQRLVPVLALAALGGLIWWTSWEKDSPLHDVQSDVGLCRERLRSLYAGLIEYEKRHGEAPAGSGIEFLGSLAASDVWPNGAEPRLLLQCPGPGATLTEIRDNSAGPRGESPGPWQTSYVVSDFASTPLGQFPAGGPANRAIVSCQSATRMAHEAALNVLYTDGSVKTFQLEPLIAQGILPAGSPRIPLGADSPIPELRLLLAP